MPESKQINTISEALAEEEAIKELVYCHLEQEVRESEKSIGRAEDQIHRGSFEDQDSFIAHRDRHAAYSNRNALMQRNASLLVKPYFAHISAEDNTGEISQFLLSDDPHLVEQITISGEDSNLHLFPFRRDVHIPILPALFALYSSKEQGQRRFSVNDYDYLASLLRDVDIEGREQKNVVQYFPALADRAEVIADEMLAQMLNEHRNDARLRNIISTLQQSQFSIINTAPEISFVVQGCAGSGKTQCMIHRLFYLRSTLEEQGWDKVLLITPSQLFRDYSNELMMRFQLMDLHQSSLAELYQRLLAIFDPRFKNRQYVFELTEEFLPDEYLRRVYDSSNIAHIEQEIKNAIAHYVSDARELLKLEQPDSEINAQQVFDLIRQLDEAVHDFDLRTQELSENKDYLAEMSALEQEEKQRLALEKRRTALEERKSSLQKEWTHFQSIKDNIQQEKEEAARWERERNRQINELYRRHSDTVNAMAGQGQVPLSLWAEYRRAVFGVLDAECTSGERCRKDAETRQFLHEVCTLSKEELSAFCKGEPEKKWTHRWKDRMDHCLRQYQEVQQQILSLTETIEHRSVRIQSLLDHQETTQNRMQSYRAALERCRFFLSRLESSVFEQEVWSALAPIKEAYGIQTMKVETLPQGGQRQTRILYKTDLLFYLHIYLHLYSTDVLPDYRMICIDEGQDLHSADYSILHTMFPQATFNIFGDTSQTLHEACGITDWQKQTGIDKLFLLDTNYRNTPEVVDFCNRSFHQNMKFIGRVKQNTHLVVCTNREMLLHAAAQDNYVLIVKDHEQLQSFCSICGMDIGQFRYLDTTADSAETDLSLCYSVFAAKGLEFTRVLVFADNMTLNQKTTACTRAISELYYYEG